MSDRVPIGTLPGLTSSLVGVDILIGTFANAATVTGAFLRHTDYDDSGATDTTVTGSIRNATAGGGSGISFEISDQTQSDSVSGSLDVAAGGSVYLRVSAAAGNDMNLTGWIELEDASGVTTALTTLARVKQFLGITASTNDALLTALINAVSGEIQSWLGRKILQTTATAERYSHNGRDEALVLDGYPVISVTSLSEDGTALVEDTGFECKERDKRVGHVVRISSGDAIHWSAGTRHITTTYVHGYATVPDEVVQAATELVVFDYRQSVPGGGRLVLTGQALDSGGTSGYITRAELWRAQQTRLARYRRKL